MCGGHRISVMRVYLVRYLSMCVGACVCGSVCVYYYTCHPFTYSVSTWMLAVCVDVCASGISIALSPGKI